MLVCESKRGAPCAGRGNGIDFDGQRFETRADPGPFVRGDSPTMGCGEGARCPLRPATGPGQDH